MQKNIQCDVPGGPRFPRKVPLLPVKVYIHGSGLVANHNYPCPVCREEHAILHLDSNLMQPCWLCSKWGYRLERIRPRFYVRIFKKLASILGTGTKRKVDPETVKRTDGNPGNAVHKAQLERIKGKRDA